MPEKWLMLNYTLPREPSRLRVGVWRQLKKAGAVSLAQAMWVLPDREDLREVLEVLKGEIAAGGGEALVMRVSVDEDTKRDFVARFGAACDEEYAEFLEQSADFLKEIAKETARRNFSFAEIEEKEADLDKLSAWLKKIQARDFFAASLQKQSSEKLEECTIALEAFCRAVYQNSKDLQQE